MHYLLHAPSNRASVRQTDLQMKYESYSRTTQCVEQYFTSISLSTPSLTISFRLLTGSTHLINQILTVLEETDATNQLSRVRLAQYKREPGSSSSITSSHGQPPDRQANSLQV